MEQNSEIFKFKKVSFCLYEDFFVYKTKKKDYLFSYSEIKTIRKQRSSVNGVNFLEYEISFLPIENFPARLPINFSIKPSDKAEASLFDVLTEIILQKKAVCFENGSAQYPEIVKSDRILNIMKKPIGTNAWGNLFYYHTDFWMFLMAAPLINIIPIIWFNICKRHFFY